jgi:hypothetical protein
VRTAYRQYAPSSLEAQQEGSERGCLPASLESGGPTRLFGISGFARAEPAAIPPPSACFRVPSSPRTAFATATAALRPPESETQLRV